ncbi:MAG: hypothetical protein ACE5FC_06310 [Myxococcota bacterium]
MKTRMRFCGFLAVVAAISLAGPMAGARAAGDENGPRTGQSPEFEGSRSEAARFMSYYRTIHLTPEEKAFRDRALGTMPAPCCGNFSMATCCCACNLARSVWGLSNHLIKQGKGEKAARAGVKAWLGALSPQGHSGNVCPTGGCNASLASGACGGMNEERLIFR